MSVTKYIEGTAKQLADQAEAIGKEYAASIGKPWPMPPDSYGPGRQPANPSLYFQKFYVAPTVADASKSLPARLEIDATVEAMQGEKQLVEGVEVTISVTSAKTLPLSGGAEGAGK
jgi:hypothetical protein